MMEATKIKQVYVLLSVYAWKSLLKKYYSLRPILLFANTDVCTTKMYLDTSILAKSIIGRREYIHFNKGAC
jgi:hypothetical protein